MGKKSPKNEIIWIGERKLEPKFQFKLLLMKHDTRNLADCEEEAMK